jgi:multimeric flavodoxin WrbA
MKVLAFNGSPKKEKGNTAMIFNPFFEGMKEAGAETELLYARELDINPCRGEANCVFKNFGRCYQEDDMNMVLLKIREADILVFASPLYFDGISGPMKNIFDRMLPLVANTFYEVRDGHLRVGLQEGLKPKKVVLVSSCGLWEMDNFDPLLAHIKAICRHLNSEFVGALLRPHANMLPVLAKEGLLENVFDSAREAGRQLVVDGKMSSDTLGNVSRELMPLEQYMNDMNRFFQQAAAK